MQQLIIICFAAELNANIENRGDIQIYTRKEQSEIEIIFQSHIDLFTEQVAEIKLACERMAATNKISDPMYYDHQNSPKMCLNISIFIKDQ